MKRLYQAGDQIATAVVTGIFWLIGLPLLVWFVGNGDFPGKIFFTTLGVVLGVFSLVRLARTGIRPMENGIRITNPLRTKDVDWGRVERFEVGQYGLYPRIGICHLWDGSRIHIWGIQGPNPTFRSRSGRAEQVVEELNHLLKQKDRRPS